MFLRKYLRNKRRWMASITLALILALVAACGGPEPTATPQPTNTPVPTATAPRQAEPTATPRPAGAPTPRPVQATATPIPKPARDLEAYFKGKTISMLVGFAPAGTTDLRARIVAKLLPKYLPGSPRFAVKNLPGGGGERAVRAVSTSKPDGLTVGEVHARFIRRELSGVDVPDYDLDTEVFIADMTAAGRATRAFYVYRNVATSWDDVLALGRPLVYGQDDRGSTTGRGNDFARLVGAPLKAIYGYGGSAETVAAFCRGEIEGTGAAGRDSVQRTCPELIENKAFLPLFYWAAPPKEDSRDFQVYLQELGAPEPPHLFDVIKPTPAQRVVFEAAENIDGGYILAPGTPDDIVAAWRDAMRKLAEDPEFSEQMVTLGMDPGYAGPEAYRKGLQDARETLKDPKLVDLFKELIGE